jgi:hypothetical protein
MTVGPAARSSRAASTFSAGVRSASTASTPIAAPTVSAVSGWSPVTITTRRTPARRRSRRVRAVSGRIGSETPSAPRQPAVDRHDLAGLDQQPVARPHLLQQGRV